MAHDRHADAVAASAAGILGEIPHWLQLAACVLFVCMLFAGSAAVGAVALLTQF